MVPRNSSFFVFSGKNHPDWRPPIPSTAQLDSHPKNFSSGLSRGIHYQLRQEQPQILRFAQDDKLLFLSAHVRFHINAFTAAGH
jgi:hypothetical protein